jgi:hypothetical protein
MIRRRHVGFSPIDPFVGAAEWTQLPFDVLHQPEGGASLPPPGAPADRATHANPGQGLVKRRCMPGAHVSYFQTRLFQCLFHGGQRMHACRVKERLATILRTEEQPQFRASQNDPFCAHLDQSAHYIGNLSS